MSITDFFAQNKDFYNFCQNNGILQKVEDLVSKAISDPDNKEEMFLEISDLVKNTPFSPSDLETLNAAAQVNPLQIVVLALYYDSFKGKMAVGKVAGGKIAKQMQVQAIGESKLNSQTGVLEPQIIKAKVSSLLIFDGLGLKEVNEVGAGEIVMVAGFENIGIGDTITTPEFNQALPRVRIDEPTIRMTFGVNTSPLSGREGKMTTSRQIRDRLYKELETNVALRVEDHPESSEKFIVSGRGELHLSVLIESMRREGFELEVSRPEVIFKTKEEVERML